MLEALFTEIGSSVTALAGVIGNGFTAAIALVWSGTAITPLGTLMLIGAGVALTWFAVNKIFGLMSIKTK